MMRNKWKQNYLGVMVDMAGCPNRCRHCWLGSHKNGKMTTDDFRWVADEFRNWRGEDGKDINEFAFWSWWREPDYRDDYRELWQLEQELSTPGRAARYELLSIWRLARDESYAAWAATLPPKVCQITFFGTEQGTDWGMRRKGAFADQLLATERCLEAGIASRWQLFLTKPYLHELDDFLRLIFKLELHKRCEAIGQKFEVFVGGISPEGNGHEIDALRLTEADVALIPKELINLAREGTDLLGKPEYVLYEELIRDDNPPNMGANMHALGLATVTLTEAMKKTKALGAMYCFGGSREFYTDIGFEIVCNRQLWKKEW